MANTNSPNGFSPVMNGDGSPWNQKVSSYSVLVGDTDAYYIGDLVVSTAGWDSVNQNPLVAKAAASAVCRGVVVGFAPDPTNLNIIYAPATKAHTYILYVCDDPNVILECTDDGLTAAKLVATAVGKNANFTVAAPTAPVPLSASVLESNSFATTSTLPFKILGLKRSINNVATSTSGSAAYARWLVRFNAHELFGLTTGV